MPCIVVTCSVFTGVFVHFPIVRLEEEIDMSTSVKFVYVHWVGDHVPFTKKGRFGVVHGSVVQWFNVRIEMHV